MNNSKFYYFSNDKINWEKLLLHRIEEPYIAPRYYAIERTNEDTIYIKPFLYMQESIEKNDNSITNETVNDLLKKMYDAIRFTLDYDSREHTEKNDYNVTFLYPVTNLSYRKLLDASFEYKKYKEFINKNN